MTWTPDDCAQQGHTPADHENPFDVEPAETFRTDVQPAELTDPETGREHGICCRCGQQRATVRHHRKLRSQGGLDTWDNSVGICADCHTAGPNAIHRHVAWALYEGWLVESWETPSTVPINYHGRGRVLLGTDGSINEVRPT